MKRTFCDNDYEVDVIRKKCKLQTIISQTVVLQKMSAFLTEPAILSWLHIPNKALHASINTLIASKQPDLNPFFSKLHLLLYRKLSSIQSDLRSETQEFTLMQLQQELKNRVEVASYNAAHVMREQLAALVPDLPPHAYNKDVSSDSLCVSQILKWLRCNAETPSFGKTCLSVKCSTHNLCAGARDRVVMTTSTKTPFTVVVQPSCLQNIPIELLHHVLSFLYLDIETLVHFSEVSRATFNVCITLPLWPVLQHHKTKRWYENMKEANQSTATGPVLSEMMKLHMKYTLEYQQLQNGIMEQTMRESEMHLDNFVECAKQYNETTIKPFQEILLGNLRRNDFLLLNNYAVDVLEINSHECVHMLPPRAFWQVSKNRKRFRKEFTHAHEASIYPGAKRLHVLQTQRHVMHKTKTMLVTSLRTLEVITVNHLHKTLKTLKDDGLMVDVKHACATFCEGVGGTQNKNMFLTLDELNDTVTQLIESAEAGRNSAVSVKQCVLKMRRMIADKLQGLCAAIFHNTVRPIMLSPTVLRNWKNCLENIRANKEVDTVLVKVVTNSEMNGLELKYTNRTVISSSSSNNNRSFNFYKNKTCSSSDSNLANIFPLNTLSVNVLQTDAKRKPDVVIMWFKNDVMLWSEYGNESVLQELYDTEGAILNTLQTHGSLTGRCCPCNRVLQKNKLIGSSCLAIINKT